MRRIYIKISPGKQCNGISTAGIHCHKIENDDTKPYVQ